MKPTAYLIALLPPPELAARLTAWQARHGLPDAAATPHVTVKPRSGLGPGLEWLDTARAAVQAHPPVALSFGPPRIFPRERAVYLPVTGRGVLSLHLALLEALRPARRFGYEGPHMQPHLSVVLGRSGLNLPELLPSLQAELAGATYKYTAHSAALMRKDPGGLYEVTEEWPLLGSTL